MKEGRCPTDCAWEGLCWEECRDASCNSTGALTWELCFHYVLWDPVERCKDYGTTGVTFLKKRTNFTFIHFIPQMNGEKTVAVKKIYNTNEHITPSEAASQLWFWCFRKRNLKKADSFKSYLSHDVHQSWISFHANSSVLWSETSKKELDNGHFFHKN